MKTLAATGEFALSPAEQETVRLAADALLFDGDGGGYDELAAVEDLVQRLVESGRWTPVRARRLVDDVAACGPSAGVR